jgi:hypothetical protein
VRLAFFVIQRSTDLFGPDFPDFTGIVQGLPDDASPSETIPRVETAAEAQQDYGRFIIKRIRALRKANVRQIAVVVLAEQYWSLILQALRGAELPLHVLERRGERLNPAEPVVALSRPQHVGGQEFDAVILAGAEHGVFPPRVLDNEALAAAVEQQALRELYLSLTRARRRVVIALPRGAVPTAILREAEKAGLLASTPLSK